MTSCRALACVAVLTSFTTAVDAYADSASVSVRLEQRTEQGIQMMLNAALEPRSDKVECGANVDGLVQCLVECNDARKLTVEHLVGVEDKSDYNESPPQVRLIVKGCDVQSRPPKVVFQHWRWVIGALKKAGTFTGPLGKAIQGAKIPTRPIASEIRLKYVGDYSELASAKKFFRLNTGLSAAYLELGENRLAARHAKYAAAVPNAVLARLMEEHDVPPPSSAPKNALSTYYSYLQNLNKGLDSKLITPSTPSQEKTRNALLKTIQRLQEERITRSALDELSAHLVKAQDSEPLFPD